MISGNCVIFVRCNNDIVVCKEKSLFLGNTNWRIYKWTVMISATYLLIHGEKVIDDNID